MSNWFKLLKKWSGEGEAGWLVESGGPAKTCLRRVCSMLCLHCWESVCLCIWCAHPCPLYGQWLQVSAHAVLTASILIKKKEKFVCFPVVSANIQGLSLIIFIGWLVPCVTGHDPGHEVAGPLCHCSLFELLVGSVWITEVESGRRDSSLKMGKAEGQTSSLLVSTWRVEWECTLYLDFPGLELTALLLLLPKGWD